MALPLTDKAGNKKSITIKIYRALICVAVQI